MLRISTRTRSLIRQALREDIGLGDVTTQALIPTNLFGTARIQVKGNGILCGGPVLKEVFRLIDPRLKVEQKIQDGSKVSRGHKAFVLHGRIGSILKGERVALNFLGRLSGIATLTRRFVLQVKGARAKIYDTRKTTPLWREIEKYAVLTGGGNNHRFGLWDEVLVKENHWFAMRPLLDQKGCRYFRNCLLPLKNVPIEVEVQNLRSLRHLLEGSFLPDRILLDHFSISGLKKAVRMVRKACDGRTPLLEASGDVTLAKVRRIARTGVDRISIGALTHSAPALDISLEIEQVRVK